MKEPKRTKGRRRDTQTDAARLAAAARALERAADEIDRLQVLCGQLQELVRRQNGDDGLGLANLSTKLWRQISAVH